MTNYYYLVGIFKKKNTRNVTFLNQFLSEDINFNDNFWSSLTAIEYGIFSTGYAIYICWANQSSTAVKMWPRLTLLFPLIP